MINKNMKILVIIRGQPRCNSNRYQQIIKHTLNWDADVDIIMDAVNDMYSHRILDNKYMAENVVPDDLAVPSFKSKDTIIENVALANEWFPERQIRIARLSSLQTQLDNLNGHLYCDWIKQRVTATDTDVTNKPTNVLAQYMWFFDPAIDYSPYDVLITVRQDCRLSPILPKDIYDPSQIHFLVERFDKNPLIGDVYEDMLLGMTHPGYINDMNKMLNCENLYKDQTYTHERFDDLGHWKIKGPSIMINELSSTRQNHKLLFGISLLGRNIDRFWPTEGQSINAFAKQTNFMPCGTLMSRHNKTSSDFNFFYHEEYNQKKAFEK
jgi:hypothetical protein